MQHFTSIQTTENVSHAILISTALLLLKYFQQLDVCQLTITKWTSQKQEGQLSDYFLNQKEGVIIYELEKTENDWDLAQNKHINIKLCN